MIEFLRKLLGDDAVLDEPSSLSEYREDTTEAEPGDPAGVAFPTTVEHVQAIVREASRRGIGLVPRVAGTNVGGLTNPSLGSIVVDLTRMNRVVEIHADDMVAVIEPGVTQQSLKDFLVERDLPLTLGYSLAPPHTSVLANALLGGLTNRSLKYGDQSLWISGVESVLADGSLVRTGAWALSDIPFARVPFPDLTGLFVGWQGTTGIVTKIAFQLWPLHAMRRRVLLMSYDVPGTFALMRRLCRLEICDDIGGLSWPSGKMMLGVPRPNPVPVPGEPLFFVYVDFTAEASDELSYKEAALQRELKALRSAGHRFEDPLDVRRIVAINPDLTAFADFPMELEFLTKAPGGGLTWIGTYGPLSRITAGAEAAIEIMTKHGIPPLIVTRPMRGGHYAVLRMITTFDKSDPEEVERTRTVNRALLDDVTARGFVIYKAPRWAWDHLRSRLDPGMLELMRRVKELLDPAGVLNPGKLGL